MMPLIIAMSSNTFAVRNVLNHLSVIKVRIGRLKCLNKNHIDRLIDIQHGCKTISSFIHDKIFNILYTHSV